MRRLLRLSVPAMVVGALLVVVTVSNGHGIGALYLSGVALLALGVVGQFLHGRRQRPHRDWNPLLICAPVSGRWRSLNSPATTVPSHTHSLAQTYAIDVTYEPQGASPRATDWVWPQMRRPQEFPSFGQPVLAPFDGVVVEAWGRSRDHLTRLSPVGMLYMFLEGIVRSAGGPRHLLGNYLIVSADADRTAAGRGTEGPVTPGHYDGPVVAVLAHLRRDSLQVSPGDRIMAGQHLADCGNSGNSSDPHVHFQLMDDVDITAARGLPFEWDHVVEGKGLRRGVPANGELFVPAD